MAAKFLDSEVWVKNIDGVFSIYDTDNDGYLKLEDFEQPLERLKNELDQPDVDLVAKIGKLVIEYCAGMGLIRGKPVTLDQYRKSMAEFAAQEQGKKRRGEEPMLFNLNNNWYDLVDNSKDGTITLDNYKKLMRASNFEEGVAESIFQSLGGGIKVDRSKLNDFEFGFWFEVEQPLGGFGKTQVSATQQT